MKTIKQLAQDAWDVQNACNLSGVAHGMARAVSDLRETLGSWEAANQHPIMILWADKVAALVGVQTLGDDRVMHAYKEVRKILDS